MFPRFKFSLFYAASLLVAADALADTQPANPPAVDDQASQASLAGKQTISSKVTAAIRESLPRYVATEAEVKKTEPFPETSDPVVLPKVTIFGGKRYDFSEREITTKSGLSALLLKRYPGASVRGQDPSFAGKTHNYAALMYADELRLQNIAELTRTVEDLKATGDVTQSRALRKEISRSLTRRNDWRTESMDRSVNGNRR